MKDTADETAVDTASRLEQVTTVATEQDTDGPQHMEDIDINIMLWEVLCVMSQLLNSAIKCTAGSGVNLLCLL